MRECTITECAHATDCTKKGSEMSQQHSAVCIYASYVTKQQQKWKHKHIQPRSHVFCHLKFGNNFLGIQFTGFAN